VLQATLHFIDRVLLPDKATADLLKRAAAASPATPASKANPKPAATATAAAPKPADKAAAGARAGNRKLLQYLSQGLRQDLASNDAQAAIAMAVRGVGRLAGAHCGGVACCCLQGRVRGRL
jgi:hypothetical protein